MKLGSGFLTMVDVSDGRSITSVDVWYYLSTSATALSGGSWSTTAPTWVDGKYMWSKSITSYSTGSPTESTPVCITGGKGNTGNTGATGTGISSISEEYYLSTSKSTQTGGSWVTTPPTWSTGLYMWTRSKIIYSNPTSTVYTTPICDTGWEAANDIQVGGRNIARATNHGTQNWGWNMQTGDKTIESIEYDGISCVKFTRGTLAVGSWSVIVYTDIGRERYIPDQEYVVSFEVLGSVSTSMVCDLRESNGTNVLANRVSSIQPATIANQWSKVMILVKTVTPLPDSSSQIVYISGMDSAPGVSYVFRNLKIEQGNKATDWTPAPEDVDNAISTVTPFIPSTHATSTASWTGVAPFASLVHGQQITYLLKQVPTGSATLNLTLSGGATTGAVNCYYMGTTRLTTHFAQGNVIRLTYLVNNNISGTNYTGWWANANYYTDTYDRIRYNRSVVAGTAITAGYLIVADSAGYRHVAPGVAFDVDTPILYAGSAISSGATGTNNFTAFSSLTVLPSVSLTAYKTYYLKGVLDGTVFTIDATAPIVDTPVDDGTQYMLIGQMITTTTGSLYTQHDIYAFDKGVLKSYAQIAAENAATIITHTSDIAKLYDRITQKVDETRYNELNGIVTKNYSEYTQDKDGFTKRIGEAEGTLGSHGTTLGVLGDFKTKQEAMIREDVLGIHVGKDGYKAETLVASDGLYIKDNYGTVCAYFTDSKSFIKNAQITDILQIGKVKFTSDSTGRLTLKWVNT